MTVKEIYHSLLDNKIPLADIKGIFDGYFKIDFNSIILHEEDYCCSKEVFEDLLSKLKNGYPVNYLIGYIDILGMRFFLNEDTLIPRIETEDFIYNYLRQNYDLNGLKILDLCTGSGFIAILIKRYFKEATVFASDIVSNALTIAKKNSEYNKTDISFIKSDFLNDIDMKFDVIISNPPYIEEDNEDVNAPFEPHIALFSGKDGLDSYRKIFKLLDSRLTKKGSAFFEIESTNANKVINLFKSINDNYSIEIIKDLYQRDRYIKFEKINLD